MDVMNTKKILTNCVVVLTIAFALVSLNGWPTVCANESSGKIAADNAPSPSDRPNIVFILPTISDTANAVATDRRRS